LWTFSPTKTATYSLSHFTHQTRTGIWWAARFWQVFGAYLWRCINFEENDI